jgi:hypothetical protein
MALWYEDTSADFWIATSPVAPRNDGDGGLKRQENALQQADIFRAGGTLYLHGC